MNPALESCAWPLSELDAGVDLLAREAGHPQVPSGAAPRGSMPLPSVGSDRVALGRAIERLLFAHGLEVDASTLRYDEASDLGAPSILRLPSSSPADDPRFLVVNGRKGRTVSLLGRDRRWHSIDLRICAEALRAPIEAAHLAEVETVLEAASIRASRRAPVTRALLHAALRDREITDAWRLGVDPGAGFATQLRRRGVLLQAAMLLVLHAGETVLWLSSWLVIGRVALDGRTDEGWLPAWALLVATMLVLHVWTSWLQGRVALGAGEIFKERLLVGALRLEPDEIGRSGAGQLLGRVLESHAVEALAVGGGIQAALAVVEVLMAGAVLWAGAAGTLHVTLLGACCLAAAALGWRYHSRNQQWSSTRLAMTHDLVERLAGHRTRLAQEAPERWHEDEDRALADYLARSQALDRQLPALTIGLPRGWTMLALAALGPALLAGAAAPTLAVSVGGVLLAALALRRGGEGLAQLSGAAVAWRQAQPLFDAAARRPNPPAIDDRLPSERPREGGRLEIRDVSFQYPGRPSAVLRGCSLTAPAGARLLIEGASGRGKSTLAALVAGLRTPAAGLVLVDGLDRRTLGSEGWRRVVVATPQFHENHVVSETFAFNLLMGRQWPPADADLDEAAEIVREVGLGDLLDRMPAGLLQLVGEGGWQLSHGERSRLFMARTLLQGGDLMILDESFAALDPANLRDTLECVLRRAPTLLVIAHP